MVTFEEDDRPAAHHGLSRRHLHAKPFDNPVSSCPAGRTPWPDMRDAVDSLPACPRASFALLDTAGHSLAWERPKLFLALARDWLTSLKR